MTIKKGDALPGAKLNIMRDGEIAETSLAEWGAGKRVVLIAVPGSFTPTCSAKHLPGYVKNIGAFADKGIDAIGCLAVNDIFVVNAWGEMAGANGKVTMFADPAGAAADEMGVKSVELPVFGNTRAARLALVAENGTVSDIYIEEPGGFKVSAAEYVLGRM